MLVRLTLAALLLTATPGLAQKKAPRDAAAAFNLDPAILQADETVTAPADPKVDGPPADATTPDPAPESKPVPEAAAAAEPGSLTLDTPIGQLVADRHGRAVLDKDLPGLSTDSNLAKFEKLSLRKFQPLTGGQLTDEMLGQVERDLASSPAKPTKSRRAER